MPYDSNVPDRRISLVAGIVGGIVGVLAKRYYDTEIAPQLLPNPAPPDYPLAEDLFERFAPLKNYRVGEDVFDAASRTLLTPLVGQELQGTDRQTARDALETLFLIGSGAGYGATRTTRRWRDIAGSFFMGARMFGAETIIGTLLGFRPGPNKLSVGQHARLLTSYWVFTFVMVAVTRTLYRLAEPKRKRSFWERLLNL